MVYIPFGIVGGVLILAGLCFAVFHCLGWTFARLSQLGTLTAESTTNGRSEVNEDNSPSLNRIGEVNKKLKVMFHVTLFLVYVSIAYRDAINSLFLFAIGVTSELHMKKSQATLMLTTYFAAAAFGRLLSIIYSHLISPQILLFQQLCGCLLLCALMSFLALDSVVSNNLIKQTLGSNNKKFGSH